MKSTKDTGKGPLKKGYVPPPAPKKAPPPPPPKKK
jgi:hypothetical protein